MKEEIENYKTEKQFQPKPNKKQKKYMQKTK